MSTAIPQTKLTLFKSKIDQNSAFVFAIFAIVLILLEPLISIFNDVLSLDLERIYLYLILTPFFVYFFLQYTGKKGVDSSKISVGPIKFSMDNARFTYLVSLSSLIALILSTFLYIDTFIFQVLFLDGSIDFQIISFQALFFINFVIMGVIAKVFGTEEDIETKYPQKKTKYIVYSILVLSLMIPAFLVKDNMFLHKGNFIDNEDTLIFVNFKSDLRFIQHLMLQALAIFMLIFTKRNELTKFLNENNKNKITFIIVSIAYFIYDMIALTTGENSTANMMKQIEIIITNASTLILISAGLTLTTRVRKFGNFSHSEYLTVGLYSAVLIRNYSAVTNFIGYTIFGIPIFGGNNIFGWMWLVFVITGVIAILGEILVFSPLERRKAVPLTLMVASIGYGMVVRQSTQELFGGQNQAAIAPIYPAWFADAGQLLKIIYAVELFTVVGLAYGIWYNQTRAETKNEKIGSVILGAVGGFSIGHYLGLLFTGNPRTTITVGVIKFFGLEYDVFTPTTVIVSVDHAWAFVVMVITVLILRYIFVRTTLGISMRATADDVELAQISGINTRRVIFWTWFIAAGITGIGALWRFESANIVPFSGFTLLLIIFAVVILGGFDSFEGTLISAFIVAGVQSFTSIINRELVNWEAESSEIDKIVFWNASEDWTQVIPFAIIILVLFVRPRGIFGVVDPRSKL